jgi:hypothetical protein
MGVVKFIVFVLVMIKIKAVLATLVEPGVAVAIEPMTVMAIGGAIAGGMGSIFGGQAQGAAIEAANRAAHEEWIQSNTQKTMNNARSQFQAAYQYQQQLSRNAAIANAAYETRYDQRDALSSGVAYQQQELSNQMRSQQSSLLQAITNRGVSSSSGMYGALAVMQSLNGLKGAVQLERNRQLQAANIDKQFKGAMSQMQNNVFMPNIELYDMPPQFGDADAARSSGMISGMLQIGSGIAGGMASMGGPSSSSSSPTNSVNDTYSSSYNSGLTNQSGGNVNGGSSTGYMHPSGGAVGGR